MYKNPENFMTFSSISPQLTSGGVKHNRVDLGFKDGHDELNRSGGASKGYGLSCLTGAHMVLQ